MLLMASPLAEGLFDGAIIQSGPGGLASFGLLSTGGLARALRDVETEGLAFAESKAARSLRELRTLSAEELMRPTGNEPPPRFGPAVDGWFLPNDPEEAFASEKYHDVPIMSGMNADEASAFPGYGQVSPDDFRSQVEARYGSLAEAFFALYPPGTSSAEAGESDVRSKRDLALAAMRRIADQREATATTNQYLYYFERGIPWPEYPNFGAFHSGELPYVFDNLHVLPRLWDESDRRLAETAASYWANFVASGDPNGGELPGWPPYDRPDPQIMILGTRIKAALLPDVQAAAFFKEYLEDHLAGRSGSGGGE